MNLWHVRVTLMALCLFVGLAAYAQSEDAASALTSQLQPLLPSNPEAGVAVGLIEGGEETTFFVGNPDFSEDTRFEYGSITKVFTAILLAQLAEEGAVQLNESVNAYLPEEVQEVKWEEVTFEQLATHTAGLPRLPPNMTYSYFERNEANYTVKQVLILITDVTLSRRREGLAFQSLSEESARSEILTLRFATFRMTSLVS